MPHVRTDPFHIKWCNWMNWGRAGWLEKARGHLCLFWDHEPCHSETIKAYNHLPKRHAPSHVSRVLSKQAWEYWDTSACGVAEAWWVQPEGESPADQLARWLLLLPQLLRPWDILGPGGRGSFFRAVLQSFHVFSGLGSGPCGNST